MPSTSAARRPTDYNPAGPNTRKKIQATFHELESDVPANAFRDMMAGGLTVDSFETPLLPAVKDSTLRAKFGSEALMLAAARKGKKLPLQVMFDVMTYFHDEGVRALQICAKASEQKQMDLVKVYRFRGEGCLREAVNVAEKVAAYMYPKRGAVDSKGEDVAPAAVTVNIATASDLRNLVRGTTRAVEDQRTDRPTPGDVSDE